MASQSPFSALPAHIEAVAIGASTGGIEALSVLLPALPADFQAAVLVVLHLAPTQESLLPSLFQSRCALPISEACDKAAIQPGHVYIAPPDYHLQVDPGASLALSIDEPVNYSRPSIDVLFESAAWVYGRKLLGVLLTGASQDGAAGLLAIRNEGGLTWAQDPSTALADTMPLSAIERGAVQETLSLTAMAARFGRKNASAGERPDTANEWRT